MIREYLERFGYSAEGTADPEEALKLVEEREFDLIILDLTLPKLDGFDFLKRLSKEIPVIISTARGDIGNKIIGFELGAWDYLAKPYEPRELVLRVEAILRRRKRETIQVGEFTIDQENRRVSIDGYPIDFTPTEFELFTLLAENRGKPLSREQLIHSTSLPPDTRNRTVDMHISNIRQKIGDDPRNPRYIKSVWGIGYKFISPPPDQ